MNDHIDIRSMKMGRVTWKLFNLYPAVCIYMYLFFHWLTLLSPLWKPRTKGRALGLEVLRCPQVGLEGVVDTSLVDTNF